MSQFISFSNISLHICILLILLIIFTHNQQISANSLYRRNSYVPQSLVLDDDQLEMLSPSDSLFYQPNDDEIPSSNHWSRAIRSNYLQPIRNINLRNGVIHFVPNNKRTIPLQLQKALYAHGIIGRRR